MIDVRTAPYAALLLRVSLGVMFIAHSLLKILVFTLAGAAGFFESIGLPGVLAYPVAIGELAGGVMLILGFYARWVALALVPVLLGAAYFAHGSAGWLFSNQGGGWEYPVFLAFAAVSLGLLGNGALAVRLPAAKG